MKLEDIKLELLVRKVIYQYFKIIKKIKNSFDILPTKIKDGGEGLDGCFYIPYIFGASELANN